MTEFVAVAFEGGRPIRTQYVATSSDAEALVERWTAEGLQANWARHEEWERLRANIGTEAEDGWPLRASALETAVRTQPPSPDILSRRFCSNCGTRLTGTRFCEHCGAEGVPVADPAKQSGRETNCQAPPADRWVNRHKVLFGIALTVAVVVGLAVVGAVVKHARSSSRNIDKLISTAYGYNVGHCAKVPSITESINKVPGENQPWTFYICGSGSIDAIVDSKGNVTPGGDSSSP